MIVLYNDRDFMEVIHSYTFLIYVVFITFITFIATDMATMRLSFTRLVEHYNTENSKANEVGVLWNVTTGQRVNS